ncbi:AAA family ATPase [Succinivibrio dextrinosolvens]|uniref:AAA family ATPase n=1 Tax=Succinivibrio dextrinosolvens TaxID=83771 RepID=UPI0004E109C2|nr:AAA family ATPase [Succinivibrio dextrinosolvens]
MKKILTDSDDFETIIRTGAAYVDKTELLEKIGPCSYSIFVRPPRFGKSLNMSMIKSFFEMNYADPANKSKPKELFQNLQIMKNKEFCEKYMGEYPVISISLKSVRGKTFEEALKAFTEIIIDLYKSFADVLYSSPKLNREYDYYTLDFFAKLDIENLDWTNPHTISSIVLGINKSLEVLTYLLFKAFGKHTIVLIDDFDEPLRDAAAYGYYENMREVTSGMGNAVLKTNSNLQSGILTCSVLVALDYGIDHLSVYETDYEYYSTMFGFTYEETEELLKRLNLDSHTEDVIEWYGGYNFANNKMVCPESLLKFCADVLTSPDPVTFEPKNYRIDAEEKEIIKYSLQNNDYLFSECLQNLLDGDSYQTNISVLSKYYPINKEMNPFWAFDLLFFRGFLTLVKTASKTGNDYVVIPNKEVLDFFGLTTKEIFNATKLNWKEKALAFKEALFNNDKDKVQTLINELLINFVSVRDTAYESFYQEFLTSVLSVTIAPDHEELLSKSENGLGFAYTIINNTIESKVAIIEYKKAEKGETFKKICAEALKQIDEKQHSHKYEQKDYSICKYGITFSGKTCWVAMP